VDAKRDHGKMTFIDLRDGEGYIVQCVGRNKTLAGLNLEDVVRFHGQVKARPEHMENPDMYTGKVEFVVGNVEVLNATKPLPITVQSDGYETDIDKRLRYRYIDLRRKRMARNLRVRAKTLQAIRECLDGRGFLEIETPILAAPTKEGARDFVVPSRLYHNEFYALPQSPQQYKQLLMTGGVPAYYQIARCFRDETPRSDRGFEFTQVDLEMAFGTESSVLHTATEVVRSIFYKLKIWDYEKEKELYEPWTYEGGQLKRYPYLGGIGNSFPIFTYEEAMNRWGTDKPDIRTQAQKDAGALMFCWIVRFPMFKPAKEDVDKLDSKSSWTFMHNPFSAPLEEHSDWLLQGQNVGDIVAHQYDLVCNGMEIGSGSVRAHTRAMLEATYKVMGYSQPEIERSVGHMLEAFDYGTPPHAGIALGIDRLVMLACKEDSMKEVIAFPTTTSGRTAVMGAPLPIDKVARKELGLP
jgi:aspartyl-tRNA synthetase